MRSVEVSARTREEAIRQALEELGAERHEVNVEILDEGSKGILGFGARNVKIRVTTEIEHAPASRPVPPPRRRESERSERPPRDRGGRDRNRADGGRRPEGRGRQDDQRKREDRERGGTDRPREARGRGDADRPREAPGRGGTDRPREARGRGDADRPREAPGRGDADRPREAHGRGDADRPREARGGGNGDRPREGRERGRERQRREPRGRGNGDRPRENRERGGDGRRQEPAERAQAAVTPRAEEQRPVAERKPMEEGRAKEAGAMLEEIIRQMGIEATVTGNITEAGDIELRVESPDSAILIGRKGRNLHAMQYLINRMMHREEQAEDASERIVIDIEGYHERRRASLEEMALRMAQRVKETGRRIRVKPLNPQERRIIHLALQDDPDVRTFSVGSTLVRSVVIASKDEDPDEDRSRRRRRPPRGSQANRDEDYTEASVRNNPTEEAGEEIDEPATGEDEEE